MSSDAKPRTRDAPSTDVTAMNASTMIAKKSGAPMSTANFATVGASRTSSTVPMTPPTKCPMAAAASACEPRPLRAIGLPSIAATTSILLNTPGESAAVVAAIDGNPMARKGRGSQALAAAAIGHFVGGIIGTALLVLLAPTVAKFAVDIGAPDFFAIMVLAFIAVTSVLGASRVRGFASLLIGLTIGLVGLDEMTGQQRLTFGSLHLADGIDVVVVAVALFAVGESLWVAAHLRRKPAQADPGRPASWAGRT